VVKRMVASHTRSSCVASTFSRAVVFALVTLLAACESLVGIHDSRVLGEVGPPAAGGPSVVEDGAQGARPRPDSSSEQLQGEGEGTAATGLGGTIGSETSAGPVGVALPEADAGPPEIPAGRADAGATGPGEPAGSTASGEGATPGDPSDCEAVPAAPTLAGTAFLFTAGPNGGNPAGAGICAFPNSELPGAPRVYAAIEPGLMVPPASLCGACLRVSYGAKSVEVTLIDVIEPNPLAHGHTLSIDLEGRRLLSPGDQNLDVEFSIVPCTGVGSIRLKFASADDPSVLVLDHRNPLASVRLSTPGVSVALVRQSYNYWQPPSGFSMNGDLVSLTLVDTAGNELSVPNVAVGAAIVDTGLQFPAPGCSIEQ
jgi:hypothetical protein